MGVIRGGLLFIAGVLLLGALVVGGVFYTAQSSLDGERLKEELVSYAKDSFDVEDNLTLQVENDLDEMELSCENNTEFFFNHSESGRAFVIPCEVVAQGTEAIVDYGLNESIEGVYSNQPILAKDYWASKFYYSLFGILILFCLIWFLVETKANSLVVAGGLTVIASLPFFALDSIAGFFVDKEFLQMFTNLFLGSHSVFIFMLVLGLILIGVGIGLRFWNFGSTKKKFSRNEVRKIVSDEVKKK